MLKVFKDKEALSNAAAELFVKTALEAVETKGKFTVALTGGSSPILLHQLLANQPYSNQVPWKDTYIFWGDERWVPLYDDKSNAKMAFETLLNHVPVPADNIYPMWQNNTEPEQFAIQYENILKEHFQDGKTGFDLILLGMGDDGHTASLFPGTEVLHEQQRWVQAYFLKQQDMYRITLTAPFINKASKIVFLTFGEKKASALYQVLEGESDIEKYPSQLIKRDEENVHWFVDEQAASLLNKE